jgi:fumarylacetoacetate (FAA) hydrolase
MRLGSLRDGSRDGSLVVVNRAGNRYLSASSFAPTLQYALDHWAEFAAKLQALSQEVEDNKAAPALKDAMLGAPLPRAYEWLDGSAYLSHVELVRKSRGADLPESLRYDPLMYQGGSGVLLGPRDDFVLPDEDWGLDLEAELCVVLGDTPRGTTRSEAAAHIRLFMLVNDWSYRNLIPDELKKGFGFVISKPATAFSPLAITPDELGDAYRDGRVHLPLRSFVNETWLGAPEAGEEMHFSFYELIEHACRTRSLTAGTLLGSGTVANRDPTRGSSCIAEVRMRESLQWGAVRSPFLKVGDRVRIEMRDAAGCNLFGSIDQQVSAPDAPARSPQ